MSRVLKKIFLFLCYNNSMARLKKILDDKRDKIAFLGTGGARFTMITQIRATAGIWMSINQTRLYLDPGPGALVWARRRGINLEKLDGIILSHKHLDHSGDINVMIEAMTHGGRKKKGIVFAPHDALDKDPVILQYLRNYPEKIEILKENNTYTIGNITFSTGKKMYHDKDHLIENYGIKILYKDSIISFVTDTKFDEEIIKSYKGNLMILNVLLNESKPHIFHLSLLDVYKIIEIAHPEKVILTHFGTTLATQNPENFIKKISEKTNIEAIAAYDGMEYYL